MARIIADVILSAAGIELGEVAVIKAAKAILLQGFFPEGKGMKMGEIVYLSPCKLKGAELRLVSCFYMLQKTSDWCYWVKLSEGDLEAKESEASRVPRLELLTIDVNQGTRWWIVNKADGEPLTAASGPGPAERWSGPALVSASCGCGSAASPAALPSAQSPPGAAPPDAPSAAPPTGSSAQTPVRHTYTHTHTHNVVQQNSNIHHDISLSP